MTKKAKGTEFNLSEEIRIELHTRPSSTSAEVLAKIKSRHPGWKPNKNSFSVAFYTTRKKLGGAVKRTKRPVTTAVQPRFNDLTAARTFVQTVGGVSAAHAVLETLSKLQIAK